MELLIFLGLAPVIVQLNLCSIVNIFFVVSNKNGCGSTAGTEDILHWSCKVSVKLQLDQL